MSWIRQYPKEYFNIHNWLRKRYGKANKCESKTCNGKSKSFHWALKKEHELQRDRKVFFMLCQSCHKLYDLTDSVKKRMKENHVRGEKNPQSKLTKLQVDEIRSKYIFRVYDCTMLAKEYNVCYHTIYNIVTNKRWKIIYI